MADRLPPLPDRQKPPYAHQSPHEVRQLLQSLQSHQSGGKGKNTFSCKQTTFNLPQLGGRPVSSWKMKEWDYKRDDLPSYARGLFIYKRADGVPEIAVRGYDKFFNIDEVNDTHWRNIETQTRGPYELSNKENGCIIFVAGLEGDEIIVCSKHSTGDRMDGSANHSFQGRIWLEKHLAAAGRTPKELAKELRSRNVTLVAELCDDSFEEHVLEYRPEDAGLYVHGMNLNMPEFATYPSHLVQQFADEWGFRKAKYVVKDNLEEAKAFLEQCGETGSWNGRDTEGFVIRCQKKVAGAWVDWFFKYKYDEPYLMYRQWREATKAVIAGKKPKYRKHHKITEAYLLYARQQLARDSQLATDYQKNHGIIAMREGFLKQQGVKGSEIIRAEEAEEDGGGSTRNVSDNVVFVPISTIGCGKTTIANALVSLFGWGHIQNDNITGQKGRPQKFANQLTNAMALHPAVIADRNNHQKRERKQIFDDILKVVPSARFVALHYVHHPKDQMVPLVREVTLARVLGRGDNHQTIRASSKGSSEIEGIMDGFLVRFEPPSADSEPDNTFDEIIDMDPREDSRQNLETVINALRKSFPKLIPTIPTPEEMDNAISASLNDYSPQLKHDLSFGGNKKDKDKNKKKQGAAEKVRSKDRRIEYFAIRIPRQSILDSLEQTFSQTAPSPTTNFWHILKATNRVQQSFHVTLVHSSASKSEIWKNYEDRHVAAIANGGSNKEVDPYLGPASIRLKHVVWDDRIMAIAVDILDDAWVCSNAFPHITVGTASQDIKPFLSNDLLARWHELGTGASGISALPITEANGVHGEVRAVTPATR